MVHYLQYCSVVHINKNNLTRRLLRDIFNILGGHAMRLQRRQFLKYCVGSAAALGLPMTVLGRLEKALAAGGATLPKVIWLNAANCTGCTVSLSNLFSDSGPTDIADLLTNTIDLIFHPTLMAAAGDLAVQQLNETAMGSYILAVEGGIPTAFNGNTCLLWSENGHDVTAMEAMERLAPNAAAVLSIGTCASYGGIPAAGSNPTGIVSVGEFTGQNTVNMPGCPTHPDWIVWTIAHLLTGETPELDDRNRPTALYGTEIHKTCPRKGQGEANTFGDGQKCLKPLGCRGPETRSDCPSRKWNNGTNWCIGAGAICIGCTERDFPDKFSPFYKIEYSYEHFDKPVEEEPNPEETPPEPTDGSLVMTKAVWEATKNRINTEGKGIVGQIVTISNADTGTQMGAVTVDSVEKWRFRQVDPSPIPHRLKAVSGSQTLVYDVANVPLTGDDKPLNDDKFELKKAEWRADKREFKVEGEGTVGNVVDIFNATSNNKIGKATVNSESKWKLVVKQPSVVACKIRAVCQGQALTRDVKNAPGGCV
jgi:hydrogenase small subunit